MSIPFSLKLLTSGGKSDLRIINLEFPGGSMYYGSGIMAVVGVATVGAGSIPSPGTSAYCGHSQALPLGARACPIVHPAPSLGPSPYRLLGNHRSAFKSKRNPEE